MRSTSTRDPRPRDERGQRVSSGGGWDGASGWWRARPGDPGAPLPSEPGKGAGVDPQSYQSLLELGGSWGFALGSKGGRNLSRARVLRGQVRKGVTLPFPVPDPIVSVACGPGRLRNTCWLHRYECLRFFFFLLLFCVCRVSEPIPTSAHRPSGRRFSTVQKSGVNCTLHLLSPSLFSPRAEKKWGLGVGVGVGEGFQLGFSISTTLKTHPPNPRFVLASHVFVGFLLL